MSQNFIRHVAAALLLLASALGHAQAQLRGLGGGTGIGGGPGIGVLGGSAIPGNSAIPNLGNPSGLPDPLAPGGSVLDRGLPAPNTRDVFDPLYGRTRDILDGNPVGSIERGALGVGTDLVARAGAAVLPGGNRPRTSRLPPAGERRFVSNEVIVSLPSSASPQTLDALIRRHRLTRLQSWNVALTGTSFHRLQISDGRSVSDVIREIDRAGGVGLAQPNYRFTLQQAPPARGSSSSQYSLAKLHVSEAHRLATGGAVPVAIIDNGIDALHPELAGAIAGHFDAVERPEAPSNHGTGMAGAIVAHARLTGVAPGARILAVRAFAAAVGSEEATTASIVRGIDWAIAQGARVINMSFAGPRDPEIASALEAAAKRGIVLVAAAGNAGPKSAPLFPVADPNDGYGRGRQSVRPFQSRAPHRGRRSGGRRYRAGARRHLSVHNRHISGSRLRERDRRTAHRTQSSAQGAGDQKCSARDCHGPGTEGARRSIRRRPRRRIPRGTGGDRLGATQPRNDCFNRAHAVAALAWKARVRAPVGHRGRVKCLALHTLVTIPGLHS